MALGQRPLQIRQGQGHHVTVRRAGRLGVRAVPAQLGRRHAQRARPPRRCHPFARRKVEHRLFRRGGLRRRRGTESKTVPTTRSEAKRSHGSTRAAGTPRPWPLGGKTRSRSRVGAAQAVRPASTASRNAGSGSHRGASRRYPRTSSDSGAQTWRQRSARGGLAAWALSAAAAAEPPRGTAWTVRGGHRRSLLGATAWALSPAVFHSRSQGGAGSGRGV